MTLKQELLSMFLLLAAAPGLIAQAPAPVAPLGVGNTMALQGGPELMDPLTLKFTFPITVRQKAGVGLDFNSTLLFNADPNKFLDYGTNAGVAFTSLNNNNVTDLSNVWTLSLTSGVTQQVLSAQETINVCQPGNNGHPYGYEYTYSYPIFSDKYGVLRQFPFIFGDASECSQNQYFYSAMGANNSTAATDGSGIYVWGSGQPTSSPVFTVYYPDGSSQTVTMDGYAQENGPPPPASVVLAQDADGNQITTNSAGTSVIDTLGQTVLSGMTISSGSVQSWGTLSYVNSANTTFNTTPAYVNYTVSNLNCPGAKETTFSASLLDHMTLPDGRTYSFTYEPSYTGTVTGRLQKVTLPSGGSISYAYSGAFGCSTGTATLTRTINDNNGNSSIWTYSLGTNGAGQKTMTIVDPANTSTLITYEGVTLQTGPDPYGGRSIEVSRSTTDQSGTPLSTTSTSYVGASGSSSSVTLPLQSSTVTKSIPNLTGVSSQAVTSYNSLGQASEVDTYDFGKVGGSVGPLLSKVVTSYPKTPGPCQAHSGCPPNLGAFPGSITTYDGAGTQIHQSIPTYNTDGRLQQVQQWVSGGNYLTTQYQYYGNGLLSTVIDPNGSFVTVTSLQCNNAYPGGTSTVVKNAAGTQTATLTASEQWDCLAGVPTSSKDVNGHQTTVIYNDPLFRPTSSQDWLGNTTTQSYPTATSNTSESVLTFNSGNSTQDALVTYDGLGRPTLNQTRQSPTATTFDTVSTTYDSYGRLYSTSLPYSAAASVVNPSIATSKTTYDSLSRPYLVTSAAGATTQYTYAANAPDTLITLGPAPSGEHTKSRQLEYNAVGQLTSVCEITSGTQSGACSQATSATGYFTQYTYDGDLLTKVGQNIQNGGISPQTRSMTYDGLGRKVSETLPETGVSTYVYDSDAAGVCSGSFPGDQIKSTDAANNVSCGTYDNHHRQLTAKTVSGPYAGGTTPQLNYVYDAATVSNVAMQNVSGALAEAYTCTGSCTSKITDAGFSSTPETFNGNNTGRITSQIYELTPHSGGYSHMLATSYPNGALGSLWGAGPGYAMPYVTYTLDGEGRLTTATDTRYAGALVTGTAYNVAGEATAVNMKNGDADTFSYDSFYRPNGFKFTVAGSSPFTLTAAAPLNSNGSVQSMTITDSSDSSKNQTCSYSADDLNRLANANCGTAWPQSFAYDPFGNISKSSTGGATNYGAIYTGTHNQVTGGTTATYDANGNQTLNTAGSFSWNAAAQVVSSNAGGGTATATYDALGRMVETVSGSNNTQFVYSPLGAQYAVLQNGTLARGTVPLPGGDTAVYTTTGSTTALNYIRRLDLLGSSRLATTWTTHAVYSKEAYAPYGEPYDEAGTADRSFTGQDSDLTKGANLYDFQFRKLDATAGRWLSPDPYGWNAVDLNNPQTLNRYVYAGNNPLIVVDPLGLYTITVVTQFCVEDYQANIGGPQMGNYEEHCEYEDVLQDLPDPSNLIALLPLPMSPTYRGVGGGASGFAPAPNKGYVQPPWLPQPRFGQGQGKAPGPPTPPRIPKPGGPGPEPNLGPFNEPPPGGGLGLYMYYLMQVLRVLDDTTTPFLPIIMVNPCTGGANGPGCVPQG